VDLVVTIVHGEVTIACLGTRLWHVVTIITVSIMAPTTKVVVSLVVVVIVGRGWLVAIGVVALALVVVNAPVVMVDLVLLIASGCGLRSCQITLSLQKDLLLLRSCVKLSAR
jgi:hypothetical protein